MNSEQFEEWRDIAGYEGLYQVSDLGRARSASLRIKAQCLNTSGYAFVGLSRNGRQKTTYIHKIVMATFVGQCPAGKEINHIDGSRPNNALANLEYVTKSENQLHAIHILGRRNIGQWAKDNPEKAHTENRARGERMNAQKMTDATVLELRARHASGELSLRRAVKEFGICKSMVIHIVKRRNWTHI